MTTPTDGHQSWMTALAMWSAAHRRWVIPAWLVLVVFAIGTCATLKADTKLEQTAPGETGEAQKLLVDRFRGRPNSDTEVVVFRHPSLTVDEPAYEGAVRSLIEELRGLRLVTTASVDGTTVVSSARIVTSSTTHYDTGAPRDTSPLVARRDGRGDVSLALIGLEGEAFDLRAAIVPVIDAVSRAQATSEGFDILLGGPATGFEQVSKIIEEDLGRALLFNLPITFILLLLAFRTVVAAALPLGLSLVAIAVAGAVLTLVSQVYPLSDIYTEMVLLMGLATGIDYALFIVSRFRRERRAGQDKQHALLVATTTSGKAVFFAGLTVILAIGGMFLVGDKTFSSLGIASIVVVAFAVIVSMTLLPALLGDGLDRLSGPFLRRRRDEGGGVWGRICDAVLARPAVFALMTTAVLLALAAPLLTLNLGFNGAKALPDDIDEKQALLALEENFTLGLISPAVVVVDAGKDRNVFASNIQFHVARLGDRVSAATVSPASPDAPFGSPIRTQVNDAGDTQMTFIPLNADTGEDRAIDAVERLRNDLIPEAFSGAPATVLVTGETAGNIDFRSNILRRAPLVFGFVLALAFLTLLVVFRSLVIAAKAIILNLLSVGATYGILVLVFQEGWLLEPVLGFEATGIVESWLPLFLFSILFGLSMDYHMFVMGRIKEAVEQGASTDEAISTGIRATAGTITNAAAVMVAVALIFAFTRNIGLKQFGFGLAVAIFLDATVIRSILLPASMKLLGTANWYLPPWLEWLPRVRMAE